jgi:hypothetical protein
VTALCVRLGQQGQCFPRFESNCSDPFAAQILPSLHAIALPSLCTHPALCCTASHHQPNQPLHRPAAATQTSPRQAQAVRSSSPCFHSSLHPPHTEQPARGAASSSLHQCSPHMHVSNHACQQPCMSPHIHVSNHAASQHVAGAGRSGRPHAPHHTAHSITTSHSHLQVAS